MNPRWRPAFSLIRTLHIYLSLGAFVLLLFFTLSGWLMVHQEALGLDGVRTTEEVVSFDNTEALRDPAQRPGMLETLGVRGRVVAEGADYLQTAAPGRAVFVQWDSTTDKITVIRESSGLSGRIFDLHRNRHGRVWGTWMQDLTAALFLLVALSGLFLWLPLPRRRALGLTALTLGLAVGSFWLTLS